VKEFVVGIDSRMRGCLRALFLILAGVAIAAVSAEAQQDRPAVGVAFGGGSARGIAHVGVIQWFEEHRIPIDMAAGTSMGGLIGGAFATGMDAAEIDEMLQHLDWDTMFGASGFAFKNIRRKADGRAYPSRLEFGLRHGLKAPPALNNGQQVDLLVVRLTAPYYGARTFDELPTPFRVVAMDLLTAKAVVLDRGPFGSALRATMSLPLIFPPVPRDGQLLVDGGTLDNVPADVVKAMGAARIVAVNVGDLDDLKTVNSSMFGLAGATIDAMMRANTKEAIAQADIVINVPLADYGSLDWRRSRELVAEGYKAAEVMRDRLLPLAVSEAEYAQWKAARQARRKTALPVPAFVRVEGFTAADTRQIDGQLAHHVGKPFDVAVLQVELDALSGLDRYQSIGWRFASDQAGEPGLLVEAQPKSYGPPFLMLGLNLENTVSDSFRVTMTARYLAYDVLGAGSELRLDATIGSDPGVAAELYTPIGAGRLFVAPFADIVTRTLNFIEDDAIVARYGERSSQAGLNVGVNLGRQSDLRAGVFIGRQSTEVQVGDPGLPAFAGKSVVSEVAWRFDSQDSPALPTAGSVASAHLRHVVDAPEVEPPLASHRSSEGLMQLAGEDNTFWTIRGRDRVFVLGGGGTSFDHTPLPTEQFTLGSTFHLGAYGNGELRGDHYYILSAGYLRQLGRLPDFLGGAICAGGWLENGDAFDAWSSARLRTNASAGVIMDSLIGPVILAGSAGFDGRWRTYVGVGRVFGGKR